MTWQFRSFLMFFSALIAALFIRGFSLMSAIGFLLVALGVVLAFALLLIIRYSGWIDR